MLVGNCPPLGGAKSSRDLAEYCGSGDICDTLHGSSIGSSSARINASSRGAGAWNAAWNLPFSTLRSELQTPLTNVAISSLHVKGIA